MDDQEYGLRTSCQLHKVDLPNFLRHPKKEIGIADSSSLTLGKSILALKNSRVPSSSYLSCPSISVVIFESPFMILNSMTMFGKKSFSYLSEKL